MNEPTETPESLHRCMCGASLLEHFGGLRFCPTADGKFSDTLTYMMARDDEPQPQTAEPSALGDWGLQDETVRTFYEGREINKRVNGVLVTDSWGHPIALAQPHTAGKPTAGPWVWKKFGKTGLFSDATKEPILVSDGRLLRPNNDATSLVEVSGDEPNFALMAEAGTVYQETGLTPRQLAEAMEVTEGRLIAARGMYEATDAENAQLKAQLEDALAALREIAKDTITTASGVELPARGAYIAKEFLATKGVRSPLCDRCQKLETALEFYADPATYHGIAFMGDPPCGEFVGDFDESHGDPMYGPKPGKTAREALAS